MYNHIADMKFVHRDYKGSIADRSRKFDIGMFRMKEDVTYSGKYIGQRSKTSLTKNLFLRLCSTYMSTRR